MFTRYLLSLLFLVSLATSLVSQKLPYHQGQLIVQLESAADGKKWAGDQPELQHYRQLIRSQNVWLLYFDFADYGEGGLRAKFNRDPRVVGVQFNRFTSARTTEPNDPLYANQWQYNNIGQIGGLEGADANICSAWDITTGGRTVLGDTIVICAIDNGVDEDHTDLVANLWVNYDEIPNNGIDDDNNGYIDDRKGWNTAANNNDINGGSHGTSVTGIIGARGNNNNGVAGVNWTTKVMVVRNNFQAAESEVLEAYGYALDARIDYDNSGGTAGAYVVATNASWGIDEGDPADSPLWCALYDTLGSYGILNVGATANANNNVDTQGDLPTACPSKYLVSVTNVNTNDEKVMNAGFGLVSIELGAHGESVYTTTSGNNYGPFGGTSAAAPMVAGAIGLLYSAPSPLFGELLASDPAAAACFMKDIILNNARPIDDLNGITVTGGVLDLGSSMDALMNIANTCLAPTSVSVLPAGATNLNVSWNSISSVESTTLRYRPLGISTWTNEFNAASPFAIGGLDQCRFYQVQLLSICSGTATASPIILVETDGCCRRPEVFSVSAQGNDAIRVEFSDVLAAVNYRLRYRPASGGAWTEQLAISSPVILSNLSSCTLFDVEISSNCDTTVTSFGDRQSTQTNGCGTCLDGNYCLPNQVNNDDEHISFFNFGNLYQNESGAETDGYRNYGSQVTLEAAREAVYPVELRPAFTGNMFTETFRIWIDYDQNGFFTSQEIVADLSSSMGSPALGSITIPDNVPLGNTRLRIKMRFNQPSGACEAGVFFGEVEDYCINITASPGCVPPTNFTASYDEVTETNTLRWEASSAPGGDYRLRYRPDGGGAWTTINTSNLSVEIDNIQLCNLFEAELYSLCSGAQSPVTTTIFNSCSNNYDPEATLTTWKAYPSPTTGRIFVEFSNGRTAAELDALEVIDLSGRLLLSAMGSDVLSRGIDLTDYPAGVYLLRAITLDGKSSLKRVVKR
jgi:hypothetical protein